MTTYHRILGLTVGILLGGSSYAQTTPGSISEITSDKISPNTSAPNPTQTLSTKIEQGERRLQALFQSENSAGIEDVKDSHTKALVESLNEVGVAYKISDTLKVDARYAFAMRFIGDREQLKAEKGEQPSIDPITKQPRHDEDGNVVMEKTYEYENPYKIMDPSLNLEQTSSMTLLDSKPLVFAARYFAPISEDSRAAKAKGVLRAQAAASWDINPRVSIDYLAQASLYIHSTAQENGSAGADSSLGEDSTLRYVTGPTATYNFNDTLNVYYTPFFDLLSTGFQRGDFIRADRRNQIFQDVGVNIILGPITINPYWETVASREGGSEGYVGAGLDSNSSYNLSINGTF